MTVFYGLLLVWTVGTIPLIDLKFQQGWFQGDWLYAVMIGFFYLYTWFWSLGLFYRIALDAEGQIECKASGGGWRFRPKRSAPSRGPGFPGDSDLSG